MPYPSMLYKLTDLLSVHIVCSDVRMPAPIDGIRWQ